MHTYIHTYICTVLCTDRRRQGMHAVTTRRVQPEMIHAHAIHSTMQRRYTEIMYACAICDRERRVQPEMSSPDPASSPVEVRRRAFVEQMMSGVAPSMLVLEQMFRQVGEAMSIVPLSPRIVKLLDLTADVRGLLPFKCPRPPAHHRKAGGDGEDMEEERWRKVRNEQELVASLRDRLFAIELTLFPHCLGREWTQEKRNAFRRRLASVRDASRLCVCVCVCARARAYV